MGGTLELTEDGHPRELGLRGADPLLGQRLLHYRVIEEIGQGGMSVVYRGRDELLGRDVAIKVLHPFLAQKAECRQRLAREARAVARLEHENILRIFAYSGDPPTLDETPDADRTEPRGLERVEDTKEGFLVVEFVPGDTLKQWATVSKVWESPEIGALITFVLAKALDHAHTQGVIHRDLKPENVMVRSDGVVKLMDFGIAQVADAKSLTITGTLLGSPAHMAPESIEGYPADERSDIFSLGTVLYWLATGGLPFEALTPHALLKAIVDGKRCPPQQNQPRVSDELAKIIERSLATRPENRYQTAAAMAADLEQYLDAVGLGAISVERVLANPVAAKGEVSQIVRARYLAKAETLLEEGHAAKALGALSRVLAEFPHDETAAALLERAHLGFGDDLDDDEDAGDEDPATDISPSGGSTEVDTAESRPAHLRRARITANDDDEDDASDEGLIAPPSRAPRPDRGKGDPITARVLARRFGLVAAVVSVLTLAVVVSNAMEPSRGNTAEPAMAPPTQNGGVVIDAPVVVSPGRRLPQTQPLSVESAREKLLAARANPAIQTSKLKLPKAGIKRDLPPANDAEPGAAVPPVGDKAPDDDASAAPLVATLRRLEIRVVPWADIYVDEKRVAENAKFFELDVAPGKHTVRLSNLKAVEAVREIDVPVTGHVPQIQVRLKPKPATLIVRSNVDADVLLQSQSGEGRRFVGSAKQSVAKPIVVAFDHRAERRFEVVLHKSGYKSVVRQVTFAAGETIELDAVLEPDVDGEETAARQPISADP